MGLPAISDIAHQHLFTDRDRMQSAGLPEATIRHVERLRDVYNYWLAFPSKRDRDIVAELRQRYGIGDTVAREDLRLIKTLLGDFQRVSKEYIRYRVTQMCERAYEMAVASNNPREMIAAAKELSKAHKLGKDDERASVLDKLERIRLSFTDDPSVIGIPRMPDFRAKIKSMKEKYWTEATEDVDFEEIDADIDSIFRPSLPNGTSAGLP